MEAKSILEQIIQNQKTEEVARLDAVEIINNLFSELNERERDVLIRRFGLHGQEKETLENIGSVHKLTRERIRQIETSSVKKLRQLSNLDRYLETLKKVIYELLEEHGGMMEQSYMLEVLVKYSLKDPKRDSKAEDIHKSYLNFLITKLLHNEFEEGKSSVFLPVYKLKHQSIEHLEELAQELAQKLESKEDNIHQTEKVIELVKEMDSYSKHLDKLNVDNNLDIASALLNSLYEENVQLINDNKVLYSVLRAHKNVEQNKFGFWGLDSSREIKPKTINDKIYLVLKHAKRPMHFVEIADKINGIAFDGKKANAATVHNELILDQKYVLVGRGLYGLKEWGYEKGTVADVIQEIIDESNQPLSRDEILKRVMEKRMVKKTTVILALMNKDRFQKVNGKYSVKK